MSIQALIPLLVVMFAGAVATVTDVWKYRVANWLTLPLLIGGVAYHTVMGGWVGLVFSLAGVAFGFGILIVLYMLGGVGSGDVKFLAGVGAWIGFNMTFQVFIIAGLLCGLYASVLLLLTGGFNKVRAYFMTIYFQGRSLAYHLGGPDRLEDVVNSSGARQRLIPLVAVLTVGMVVAIVMNYALGINLVSLLMGRVS